MGCWPLKPCDAAINQRKTKHRISGLAKKTDVFARLGRNFFAVGGSTSARAYGLEIAMLLNAVLHPHPLDHNQDLEAAEQARNLKPATLHSFTDRLIRLPELLKIVGLSRSSVYGRLKPDSRHYDASFPKPIPLSNNPNGAVAWSLREVLGWVSGRAERREVASH